MKYVSNFDILLRSTMLFCGLFLLIGCSTNKEIQPMTIQKLIDCWKTSDPSYTWNPPATEEEIRAAEEKIGSTLPSSLRELYGFFNGGDDILGQLFFYRLEPTPDELLGLTNATEMYIEWQWCNPQEVLLFADEGGSDVYGIWLPETDSEVFRQPIIEVGSIQEEGCMDVVGTNLESFLLGRSAYYLMLSEISALTDVEIAVEDEEDPTDALKQLKQIQTALEMLQVPQHLRTEPFHAVYEERFGPASEWRGVDHHFAQIRKWADPLLPNPYADSYSQRYTVTDLKKLFGEPKSVLTKGDTR